MSRAGQETTAEPATGDLLTEHLVRTGKLKPADVDRALQLAQERPQSLGLLLTRVGLVSDRDVAGGYAAVLERPLLSDNEIPAIPPEEILYKEGFLRDAKILPLGADADELKVATADPENTFALEALAMAAGKPVSYVIGTAGQIERALDLWLGSTESAESALEPEPEAASLEEADAIERLRDLASEAPVVRLVNSIIAAAVEARASDIHVEPVDGRLRVRYRVDGVLLPQEPPAAHLGAAVISRIKLMARMNIAERRLPQDGRAQIRVQGNVVDLRVSTVPTMDSESVVLRILDQGKVQLKLDSLGFDPQVEATLRHLIERPHGIVLVTGPTGSGKTTTLYAVLQQLNSTERKILTIEDPVEYQLDGVNQIQVKPQIGLDFPRALRAIVRQDPDVIMIGEMRDLDTARIAVQSALTGHLVFSTLHTNDAGSSVTRLLDMGVEDYLVTSSVNAIVAQRLVRKLCTHCRRAYTPADSAVEGLRLHALAQESPVQLYEASGCAECQRTGFRGRTVIVEALVFTETLRRAVLTHADGKSIEKIAVEEGMQTMQTDGLRKALAGVTTVEEVTRVTSA